MYFEVGALCKGDSANFSLLYYGSIIILLRTYLIPENMQPSKTTSTCSLLSAAAKFPRMTQTTNVRSRNKQRTDDSIALCIVSAGQNGEISISPPRGRDPKSASVPTPEERRTEVSSVQARSFNYCCQTLVLHSVKNFQMVLPVERGVRKQPQGNLHFTSRSWKQHLETLSDDISLIQQPEDVQNCLQAFLGSVQHQSNTTDCMTGVLNLAASHPRPGQKRWWSHERPWAKVLKKAVRSTMHYTHAQYSNW